MIEPPREFNDLIETGRAELVTAKIDAQISRLRCLAAATAIAWWSRDHTCWVPKRYLPPRDERPEDQQRKG
jgi:hypothetical protein